MPSRRTGNKTSPNPDNGHGVYDSAVDKNEDELLSQTLNADGGPKRPMNAFMIFARRQRSIVSAQNPTLITGEISKILSKQWNSMPAAEKQCYFNYAKQAKDKFNSRYPDYAYHRSPNNTRKKRRAKTLPVASGMHSSVPRAVNDDANYTLANTNTGGMIPPVDNRHIDHQHFGHASTSTLPQHHGFYSSPYDIMIHSATGPSSGKPSNCSIGIGMSDILNSERSIPSGGMPNMSNSAATGIACVPSSGDNMNNAVASISVPPMLTQTHYYMGDHSQHRNELPSSDSWPGSSHDWSIVNSPVPVPPRAYIADPNFSWF